MADPSEDPKLTVARGYDRIAEGLLRDKQAPSRGLKKAYLDRMTERLDDGATILDLGCGAGVPVASYLSARFNILGVDISRGQLALARTSVPKATFILADMCSLALKPASFDAVVALYSIIHVPRREHAPLLDELYDVLRPGGELLAVLGQRRWEGTEANWLDLGAEMYWSHFDAKTSIGMVERAGFRVRSSTVEPDPFDGAHLFVLAEKPT
jgi:ubiquinone/menaquinone biosynthesis C-methylase UbiE